MLLSYQECIEKYGSDYKIKKNINEGELFVAEKGIYSDTKYVPELEIISKNILMGLLLLIVRFIITV